MSPSIYQMLQSCGEPRIMEPRVLRLKLAQPKRAHNPDIPCFDSEPHNTEMNNTDIGGWNFLESLTNNDYSNNTAYLHPVASPSKLSEKSLEMCTESLGSETGSDGSECSDGISLLSLESGNWQRPKSTTRVPKQMTGGNNFPPPLTSTSGANGVQVRPHREGGRLLLIAVNVSSSPSCFHAEREGGRLRLRLRKNCVDNGAEEDEENQTQEEVYKGGKGMNYYGGNSRCKEGVCVNKELLNWEPFWVST